MSGKQPHIYLGATVASTILALTTSVAWLKLPLQAIGLTSGTTYLLYNVSSTLKHRKYKQGMRDELVFLGSSLITLKKQVESKRQELAGLIELESDELQQAIAHKEAQLMALDVQLEELALMLADQEKEIDLRHIQAIAKLEQEQAKREAVFLASLEEKEGQLTKIAEEDEAWLQTETERLAAKFDEDKALLVAEHNEQLDRLKDRIEYLEQELVALTYQIRDYEKPRLPSGVEQNEIAARRVIETLHSLGVITDYEGSWLDADYIYVRVKPRTGGQKQIDKWLDRLMIELSLAERPTTCLVPGAVQIYLKPRSFLPIEAQVTPLNTVTGFQRSGALPSAESNTQSQAVVESLNAAYYRDFVEPQSKHSIYGAITQTELDWVNWLWNFHEPRPIRNQKAIVHRIWGKKSGDGVGWQTARGRLHRIALILGIDLKGR